MLFKKRVKNQIIPEYQDRNSPQFALYLLEYDETCPNKRFGRDYLLGNFILKGCQHVAGGRAQRTPPVNSNKLSRPEGDARQTHCWHPSKMRFSGLRAGDGVLLITGYKLYSVREKT